MGFSCYFSMSNSVNFYELNGSVTFNIAVHELIFVYSFLLDHACVQGVTGRHSQGLPFPVCRYNHNAYATPYERSPY